MKGKKEFGSFIKLKRIEKNYSQKDLAELLFVTESAVSKWERGVTYPDITLISDICRVLDVSEHELIESSQDTDYRKMKHDANKYNKIKKTFFWIFNISYAIALLTCFIVNLAVSHTLSWFFVVLASIICAYTFCPTLTWVYNKFKLPIFIGSTLLGLFLLFLTLSIRSGNYWFMIPTMGLLLGYFLVIFPILFVRQKKYMDLEKYNKLSKSFLLIYSVIGYLLIILLLVTIYAYKQYNLGLGVLVSTGCCLLPIVFGVISLFDKNKIVVKITAFILLGLFVIAFVVAFILSLSQLNSKETKTYIIEEGYNNIDINISVHDVEIYLSNENKIIYEVNDKHSLNVSIENDCIKLVKEDELLSHITMFDLGKLKVEIYLTKDTLNSLRMRYSTGDIKINEGFTFGSVNIDASTGDFVMLSCNTNDMNIKVSTGDIVLTKCVINGDLACTVSTGKIVISDTNIKGYYNGNLSTGDAHLHNVLIEKDLKHVSGTGDFSFDKLDAENLEIETGTGDVRGTLLSSKVFMVKTSTGDIDVPETTTGGICKVKTSTGEVYIRIV